MPNSTFTLTMLGTDTEFVPNSDLKKNYPQGETLSIISTLIPDPQNEIKPIITDKEVSQYKSVEAEVIKGPTTSGADVNDRIARGISAIWNAISRGQTNINLIAHSRGAVESILISHEMNLIKDFLTSPSANPNATYEDLIKFLKTKQYENWKNHSNTPEVIAILEAQFKSDSESFGKLKEHIAKASINLFAIDPVPGDPGSMLTWYDRRYFKIPAIVKNAEIYYYENERTSWGFTPILPTASDNTQNIKYMALPGHHGTGSSGTNKSQQNKDVNPSNPKTKTTHVQKLMIFKLLEFLGNNGVSFQQSLDIFKQGRKLGRKYVHYREDEKNQIDFPGTYRALYAQIKKNKAGYDAYNKTNYVALGNLSYRQIIKGMDKNGNHLYERFEGTFPASQGYVNEEHAKLMQDYFFKKLGLDAIEFSSIDQLVAKARQEIIEAIRNLDQPEEMELNKSITKMAPVLKEKKAREDILNTYSDLIKQISQKYLTTDWSSIEQQQAKSKLAVEIKTLFKAFNDLKSIENKDVQEFVNHLIDKSLSGVRDTVTLQFNDLQDKINQLQSWPDAELNLFFKKLVFDLDKEKNAELINQRVDDIFNSKEFTLGQFASVTEKIQFLYQKMEMEKQVSLSQLEDTKGYTVESLNQVFNEHFGQTFEDYEKVYHQMTTFLSDVDALIELDPSLKIQLKGFGYDIQKQIPQLIDTAAQRIYSQQPFAKSNGLFQNSFAELVEEYAIKHYGVQDPIKQKHDEEIKKLNEENKQLTQDLATENEKQKNALINLMNDPKEAEYLILISNKLIPMTQNYLQHLEETGRKEDEKYRAVSSLLQCLNSKEAIPTPSKRVKAFYSQLNECEKTLQKHQDPEWKQYVKSTLIVLGILASGILIGLGALAIYATTNERRSMFFWNSEGHNLVKTLKEKQPEPLEENDSDEDLDPQSKI